ncbi:MAG: hypothetical protein IJL53_03225 [Firmicutes bacterium]|nr:hypothetical protein [Bacillota bacterium]
MRYIRSILAIVLIFSVMAFMTACVEKDNPLAPQTSEGQSADIQSSGKQQSTESSVQDSASDSKAIDLPSPVGADSVKTLLQKSLDYLHSGCDYSLIEDVHDPVAYLAYFIMEDFYEDEELSFKEAREKAALLYTDAETFKSKDPKLAEMIMDEMDVEDPQELVNEYMTGLRDAIREGKITQENSNYDKFSSMLEDWDKGTDYIFEHYPELLQQIQERGIVFDLEGAMEKMRSFGRLELYHGDLEQFQTLECEYRPENIYVEESGFCSYDMGKVIDGNDVWYISMLYYVENEVYYLMGFDLVVGSMGG